MNAISFPKMFRGNATVVDEDSTNSAKASLTCLHLLLGSECETLFGDPEFGLYLRKYMFDQNNFVLRDILIDEIYTKITTFCPQIFLERKNIKITNSGKSVFVNITCKDKVTFRNNIFNLKLFESEENE